MEYKLREIIAVYRNLFKASGQGELLLLPSNMKFLPMFILALLKNVCSKCLMLDVFKSNQHNADGFALFFNEHIICDAHRMGYYQSLSKILACPCTS